MKLIKHTKPNQKTTIFTSVHYLRSAYKSSIFFHLPTKTFSHSINLLQFLTAVQFCFTIRHYQ